MDRFERELAYHFLAWLPFGGPPLRTHSPTSESLRAPRSRPCFGSLTALKLAPGHPLSNEDRALINRVRDSRRQLEGLRPQNPTGRVGSTFR